MDDADKIDRQATHIAATAIDGWLSRNRPQIANGAGLLHDVRIDLQRSIARAIRPLLRAGLKDAAEQASSIEDA